MTKPNVLSITGYPVNNDGLSNLLNEITLGHYFKPGVQVEIKVEDPQPSTRAAIQISGIKEVGYQVYELDESGNMTSTSPLTTDTSTPGSNGILSFKLNDVGNYRVCATVTDNAMNESTEKCSDLNIKKIDIDVDDDGKPDFNDPDGDGCPDLNIKWKDPNDPNKWVIINGDRDYDGIPDLNIDSDGDGKPDLNIDTDNDSKPDLDLVILKKSDWKPTKCVKKDITQGVLEEYCTGTTVKPIINVDVDNDHIPDINIDTTGDMKADFNISKDGKTPSLNIGTVHKPWKPDKNYTHQGFTYDTDLECKPYLNIDSDGDGYPDLNLDLDDDGKPDINIDIDGNGIPDTNIDSTGDGQPNINIDNDGDGIPDENIVEIKEWEPNKNIDGEFPYDTMDISEPKPNNPDDGQDPANPQEPNDVKDPSDSKTGNQNPANDDPDANVQGSYYPGNNVGGASTGDSTNLMMYVGISLLSLGVAFLVIYKKKAES